MSDSEISYEEEEIVGAITRQVGEPVRLPVTKDQVTAFTDFFYRRCAPYDKHTLFNIVSRYSNKTRQVNG